MELEELSARAKELYEAANEEVRLTTIGLKDSSDLAAIYKKYEDLGSKEMAAAAKKSWHATKGEEAERWRVLYFFCEGFGLGMASAKQTDRLLNELMRESIEVDGKSIPYFSARNILVNEKIATKREEIFEKMNAVIAKTNPTRKLIVAEEQKQLESRTGYKTATEYLAEQKQLDYATLLGQLESAFDNLTPLYEHHMGRWAKQELGMPLGEVPAGHFSYLLKMNQYDELFPDRDLLLVCTETLENLGCNLANIPQIKVDDSDRPKKNPRACCIPLDPPKAVHLIIKPVGGSDDYHQFLHEVGHALHFALLDPALPYEQRNIGTSHALTEIYSFLFESLTRTPLWLRQYLGMGEELAWEVSYYTTLVDLALFRRYIGKLQYELEFYRNPTDWEKNSERYAEILSKNVGFGASKDSFLDDIDDGLYAADYLRAWITAAQLRKYLNDKWGERWFMEAAAGDFLKGLWKKGLSIENEDISKMIGEKPFDTSALIAEYHDVLTSNPI
jgi:hypothetical protein